MRIKSLGFVQPSKVISNKEILDMITQHSTPVEKTEFEKTLRITDRLLNKSGFKTRYWFENQENILDKFKIEFNKTLDKANLLKSDVDLLIHSSVTRGFAEPANSAFIANKIGLSCRNYDIVDACMGWATSMDVINSQMKAGIVRNAVIVNIELPSLDGGVAYPKNFILNSIDELDYKFASYTLGDAATVTIVSNENPENFNFRFSSNTSYCNVCTIPIGKWKVYCDKSDISKISPEGDDYRFVVYGSEINEALEAEIVRLFKQCNLRGEDFEHVFVHTSSPALWAKFGRMVGVEDKIYQIGQKTGNVVSASMPLSLINAEQSGLLKPGDKCLAWLGSAGMVFNATTFTY